MINGMVDIVMK